jgi:hypothetical protein
MARSGLSAGLAGTQDMTADAAVVAIVTSLMIGYYFCPVAARRGHPADGEDVGRQSREGGVAVGLEYTIVAVTCFLL